jgi:hypothetical protein
MGLERSRSKPEGRVPDSLGRLWRFFEAQREAWRAANAGFERRDVAIVDGTRWTIICKIHAVRSQRARVDKLDFRASITVWPGTTAKSKRLARVQGVSNDGRTVKGWRRQFERKIRQQGYRGRWQRFPGGQFGDFWKTLRDARAVLAEVKRLDNLLL